MQSIFRNIVFYPFLFALFIIIGILSANLNDIFWTQAVFSLVILWSGVGISTFVLYKFVKNFHRAGFLAFLFLTFIFYYGHVSNLSQEWVHLIDHRYQRLFLLTIWIMVYGIFFGKRFWRRFKDHSSITLFLNIVSIISLAAPLTKVVTVSLQRSQEPIFQWQPKIELAKEEEWQVRNQPDIYYIILDGYGRSDVLRNIYGFDNSEFIRFLERKGFYIADQSKGNYLQTALSLTSSLNLEYIDGLALIDKDTANREPLKEMIEKSKARLLLEEVGYQVVSVESGYGFTELSDSDVYRSSFIDLNEFEELLLTSSLGVVFEDYIKTGIPFQSYKTHRQRLEYGFRQLVKVQEIRGPKFVFVHFLAPHPPFVFNAQGNPVEPSWPFTIHDANLFPGSIEEYESGYIGQIQYVNMMLENAITSILENSEVDPIILIQGDHGPRLLIDWNSINKSCTWEAASILSAYYLPNLEKKSLYESISPVNSFRLIFDMYFGSQFGLLEDKTYFSNFARPFRFEEITERSEQPCN